MSLFFFLAARRTPTGVFSYLTLSRRLADAALGYASHRRIDHFQTAIILTLALVMNGYVRCIEAASDTMRAYPEKFGGAPPAVFSTVVFVLMGLQLTVNRLLPCCRGLGAGYSQLGRRRRILQARARCLYPKVFLPMTFATLLFAAVGWFPPCRGC